MKIEPFQDFLDIPYFSGICIFVREIRMLYHGVLKTFENFLKFAVLRSFLFFRDLGSCSYILCIWGTSIILYFHVFQLFPKNLGFQVDQANSYFLGI